MADQIGKLATDSANAVVNTKELIGKTVEEIEKGNRITEVTAESFDTIIEDINTFASIVKEVNINTEAQAKALLSVERGISQIAEVTSKNVAVAEECTTVSEELADDAAKLDGLIKQYKE